MDVAGLHHVSCLAKLCELSVEWLGMFSLTPDLSPGFVLPASLQSLDLRPARGAPTGLLDPALLHNLTNLEILRLAAATLITNGGVAKSGEAFLAVLPVLQRLKQLRMQSVTGNWPAVSAGYSALVSTRLTSLLVQDGGLPVGACQRIFAPGCILPQLEFVSVWDGNWGPLEAAAVHWDQAAVLNLASCCPGLDAWLGSFLQPGVGLAALQPLAALTWIDVNQSGSAQGARSCMQVAASLTQLQRLTLKWLTTDELTPGVLQPLTALRQLTFLHCTQVVPGSTVRNRLAFLQNKVRQH